MTQEIHRESSKSRLGLRISRLGSIKEDSSFGLKWRRQANKEITPEGGLGEKSLLISDHKFPTECEGQAPIWNPHHDGWPTNLLLHRQWIPLDPVVHLGTSGTFETLHYRIHSLNPATQNVSTNALWWIATISPTLQTLHPSSLTNLLYAKCWKMLLFHAQSYLKYEAL